MSEAATRTTRASILRRHLRHNAVGYSVAVLVALALSPLPSQAADLMIGTERIKNRAVTAEKLHRNAVKSGKIADGTVGKADLAPAARGFTSVVTKLVTVPDLAPGAVSTETVDCGSGSVALGGGGYALVTAPFAVGVSGGELVRSHPAVGPTSWHSVVYYYGAGDNEAPNAWRTSVRNDQANPTTVQHYAMCARK